MQRHNCVSTPLILSICFLILFPVCELQATQSLTRILRENWYSIFRNISFYGNIFHVQCIGSIPTLNTRITLHVRFNSSSTNRSPYAGLGWSLPFLESKIFQLNDNLYILYMPDGYIRYFVRDKKNKNRLWGRNRWKADIDDEIIVVSKGTMELTFKKGSLLKLKDQSYNLVFQYKDGRVEKIFERGKCILQIKSEDIPVKKIVLESFDNQKIELEMTTRPYYLPIKKRLKKITVPSLSKITTSEKFVFNFEYSIENDTTYLLKCSDGTLGWDIKTNLAKRIDNNHYKITPAPIDNCSASIEETYKTGSVKAFWQKNDATGKEIVEYYGVRQIESYFISGILKGKKKRSEQHYQGKLLRHYDYSYDDKGRLIRIHGKDLDLIHIYDQDKLAVSIKNGKIKKSYTDNAFLLAKPFLK